MKFFVLELSNKGNFLKYNKRIKRKYTKENIKGTGEPNGGRK